MQAEEPLHQGRPQGRDEVVAALTEAAADLFAEHGVSGVTVRRIAEAAGVNHGLVHRHFGSKEELARRVGEYFDDRMRRAVGEPRTLAEAVRRASAASRADPRLWRYIARLILEGGEDAMPRGPGNYLRSLAELAGRAGERDAFPGGMDPRETVFIIAALGLGMELFGDYLAGAVGLPGEDLGALEERFGAIIVELLARKTDR